MCELTRISCQGEEGEYILKCIVTTSKTRHIIGVRSELDGQDPFLITELVHIIYPLFHFFARVLVLLSTFSTRPTKKDIISNYSSQFEKLVTLVISLFQINMMLW